MRHADPMNIADEPADTPEQSDIFLALYSLSDVSHKSLAGLNHQSPHCHPER
jgi:hypothetical protein